MVSMLLCPGKICIKKNLFSASWHPLNDKSWWLCLTLPGVNIQNCFWSSVISETVSHFWCDWKVYFQSFLKLFLLLIPHVIFFFFLLSLHLLVSDLTIFWHFTQILCHTNCYNVKYCVTLASPVACWTTASDITLPLQKLAFTFRVLADFLDFL